MTYSGLSEDDCAKWWGSGYLGNGILRYIKDGIEKKISVEKYIDSALLILRDGDLWENPVYLCGKCELVFNSNGTIGFK